MTRGGSSDESFLLKDQTQMTNSDTPRNERKRQRTIVVASGIIVPGRSAPYVAFSAHFDGKVIVPEHAVNLPLDRAFVVHVETPVIQNWRERSLRFTRCSGWPKTHSTTTCRATFPRSTITTSTAARSETDSACPYLPTPPFGSRCSAHATSIILMPSPGSTIWCSPSPDRYN